LIHVFYGADAFSIQEALSDIKMSFGEFSMLDANMLYLAGAKLRPEELQTAVQALPFFGDRRLVIVSGLLERFEAKEKRYTARKSTRSQTGETLLHQTMADIINNAPDSTVIVIADGDVGKSNPLLKSLTQKADIRVFPSMKDLQLKTWARRYVEKAEGQIDQEALELLVKLVGSDLWVMHGEIEKLVLYAAGRTIKSADVRKLVSLSRDASIFTLVDAIVDGLLNVAQQSMSELLDAGAAPSYILVMLARQLRLMVRAKELKKGGQPESAVQSTLGLADYPFRKTLKQAERYSMTRLHDFYHRLLETDLSIKTGKYNDELALMLLIAELCSSK
jgi:DNA polymerase-3 subunit delta